MRKLSLLLALCMLMPCLLHATGDSGEWGVVNVSVSNTRAAADYNAGMESQALLGMPVRVLETKNEWTKVETPEHYVHWTLSAAIQRMTREQLTEWNSGRQVVVTALCSSVYELPSAKSQTVSDVVAGNRLRLLARKGRYYRVLYPDGREGYLSRRDCQPVDSWRSRLDNSPQGIIRTAFTLMGIPYMWGGTSPKGVDCSGFIRTVLYMHDIIIPRNASQQARKGTPVTLDDDFAHLQPGDLLFFGKRNGDGSPARVQHVGMYIGDKRFIHSLGRVRIASLDSGDPLYDEYDLRRLLSATRFLPHVNREDGLFTTDESDFYK